VTVKHGLRSLLFCDVMQPRLVVSYRSLGTMYWSRLQGLSIRRRMLGTNKYAFILGMVWAVIGS
jgi:hypothetical protein